MLAWKEIILIYDNTVILLCDWLKLLIIFCGDLHLAYISIIKIFYSCCVLVSEHK